MSASEPDSGGRSLRILELFGWFGTRDVCLPTAWAQSHDDCVVAFHYVGQGMGWHAVLISLEGHQLLTFPWYDQADRNLRQPVPDFPVDATEDAWDDLEQGWWAWARADGDYVYVAESTIEEVDSIKRRRTLTYLGPGRVAVDGAEFSWSRVPRVAYQRAWRDAIERCRVGTPSPVAERREGDWQLE